VRGLADDPACAGRRPQLTLTVPSESASPAGPGGVGHPAAILPARATTAAHEPVIIFGTYLASPAPHAHPAPRATGCDTISPRPRNALVRGYFGCRRQVLDSTRRKPSRRFPAPLTFSGRAIFAYRS
jgi:hypothetical protein